MLSIENLHALFLQHPVISTDTRNIIPNSIFFALKGENFDGNNFVEDALEKGAALAVTERNISNNNRIIMVPNVEVCLQQLALFHRNTFNIPVLTITGSNGKTTTKELTKAVISKKYNTLATEGNLNNHIGVPLTLLKLKPEHEFAIIETGANHPGEIDFLCKIANPDFGIITNIGKAHLEGFGSFEGVVQTKTEMYRFLKAKNGTVFVNATNNLLMEHAKNVACIQFGKPENEISAEIMDSNPFAIIKLKNSKTTTEIIIQTKLAGSYNVDNIMAAAAIGNYFNVSAEEIKQAVEAYEPTNKRSQIAKTEHNMLWIDAYNANPISMKAAIESFSALKSDNKIAILGDMFELGAFAYEEHKAIITHAKSYNLTKVYFVGANFIQHKLEYPEYEFVISTSEMLNMLKNKPLSNAVILLKGSRGMALEKLIPEL